MARMSTNILTSLGVYSFLMALGCREIQNDYSGLKKAWVGLEASKVQESFFLLFQLVGLSSNLGL